MKKFKVAAVQMNSCEDKEKNLKQAARLISKAARGKAKFIALPEVFNYRGNPNKAPSIAERIPGYSTEQIAKLAKKYKAWVLIGSLFEIDKKHTKPFNTSVLINPKGRIVATYRKMHLFDINLKGKVILESSRNQPGKIPKLASIGDKKKIKVGLSICYDIRFPELYRIYSKKGAKIICIPSSFTKATGEAHWHSLIKARAIENLCFIIAPGQYGIGSSSVKTYGHSLIVDPWGNILAEGPSNKEAVIFADIDLEHLKNIRANLPALEHRKIH